MNEIRIVSIAAITAVLALGGAPVCAVGADIVPTHRLSAGLSTDIAVASVAACAKLGYAISASVVDVDGVTQAFIRGDGAGIHTVQAAHDKAFTAVSYGRPGSAIQSMYIASPPSGVILKEPYLIPGDGGLPIKIGAETVGALGISGSPGKDEECGNVALDGIKGRLK